MVSAAGAAVGTLAGCTVFALGTYYLQTHMEFPLKFGWYPDVILDEVKVSIQLSTLNEENYVGITLDSIVSQPLYKKYHPENIEFILIDSYSEDRTVEIAKEYVDRVIYAPRGLFTARNIGAKSTDADIIVTVDAAQFYPEGWLNMLLRHFEDPEVVAVTGAKIVSPARNIFYKIGNLWGNFLQKHIWGDNAAIRRWAWFAAGGWREDINQFSFSETFKEEFDFYRRLEGVGKVVKDITAVTYDTRTRFACGTGLYEDYCLMIERGERF